MSTDTVTAIERFEDLRGYTLAAVEKLASGLGDEIRFTLADGRQFRLWHREDWGETVEVEDICGDLATLVGSPLVLAEEAVSEQPPAGIAEQREYQPESETWTFYKLATVKGSVTIRWWGRSNGYYSESVDFDEVP